MKLKIRLPRPEGATRLPGYELINPSLEAIRDKWKFYGETRKPVIFPGGEEITSRVRNGNLTSLSEIFPELIIERSDGVSYVIKHAMMSQFRDDSGAWMVGISGTKSIEGES